MPMPPVARQPPLIALMGPTASGKTRLAIELAQALEGEIISVDSAQIYRGLDIGTAKPTLAERAGVPHHLLDLLDPLECYSTGRFREDALRLMAEITARGRVPILAGGTLLYFKGLLDGLAELPAADPEVRAEILAEARAQGWAALHDTLRAVDPQAALRIHPNDPQRIQRALEVYRLTGRSLSELCREQASPPLPYHPIRLVLMPASREALRERIRLRFLEMMRQGFLTEVESLYRRGDLHPGLASIRAVGYRQAWGYLSGEYGYNEMIERAVTATRQFAKRQLTWLRRESAAHPFESEETALTEKVLQRIRETVD
jgi:tRNA dimethylallyltransferase